jgi:hypothetical protein
MSARPASQTKSKGSAERTSRGRPTLGSRPGFWPTAALAAASFLLMFEVLAFQLRHGNDPALGSAAPADPAKPPRPVLIRRVVETRVIADRGLGWSAPSVASSAGDATQSNSTATASAPSPAPAPAPSAPVVSGSS